MYNLLEYSKNHEKITGSFWNYYRYEQSNPLSSDSESFKYKTSITGKLVILVMVKKIMMKTKLVKKNKKRNCYSTKTFKKVLENIKYSTD